jgi:hypothetical protein
MQQQYSNGILLRQCIGVQNQNNMLLWFASMTADCKCTTGDPVEAIAGLGLIDNWIVQSSNTISSSIAIHSAVTIQNRNAIKSSSAILHI